MKTVCIYHSIDLDGWMSAAIVKRWWNKNLKTSYFGIFDFENRDGILNSPKEKSDYLIMLGYNYGQPIPDLSEYDQVIMVDISFKDKDNSAKPMIELYESIKAKGGKFIYIDHHISSINDIKLISEKGNIPFDGLINTKFAACELTWQYFFPNEPMPEIVRLLGRYDCFGHKNTDEEQKVLEFQYGARQCISNYEEAYYHLQKCLKDQIYNGWEVEIHEKGKSIYQYLCTEAKQVYKNGFSIYFNRNITITDNTGTSVIPGQYKFICINKERFNPINFGINYHKEGYDGCACFHYDGVAKLWRFSLYNDNGKVDCSAIAKQYGGGGHKGAAGFVIKDLNLIF